MNDQKPVSRPFSRAVALGLWTILIGGAMAVSMLVLPQATRSFENTRVALPSLTAHVLDAGQMMVGYWYAVLGGYLAGVVVIGLRTFDRVIGGVNVLLGLAIAAASIVVSTSILMPLWSLAQVVG